MTTNPSFFSVPARTGYVIEAPASTVSKSSADATDVAAVAASSSAVITLADFDVLYSVICTCNCV